MTITEEMEDDFFADEAERQKNIEAINRDMEEIKVSDERLAKIKESAATETEKQMFELVIPDLPFNFR